MSRRTKDADGALDSTDVSPRVARRERRRERSREEIVDATRRVLARDGLSGTTLDAVAREVGLTKAALYYYYPSKDALLFDAVYDILERQATAISAAVDETADGPAALRAIIRETMRAYEGRLDDFRAAYLHAQVAGPGSVAITAEQLAKIRPLNERMFAGAARRLAACPGSAPVDPRLMAFLANVSALGVLTLKGMVESLDDPLLYTDEQLMDALARIFEAAAGQPRG
jgi:AcrR family transcriptional regulator